MATKTRVKLGRLELNGKDIDDQELEAVVIPAGTRIEVPVGKILDKITPPRFALMSFKIRGSTLYIQNRFSNKAQTTMRENQAAGSQAKKGKLRAAKDFQQCYEDAKHVSTEGWCGIPSSAFRKAAIRACTLVNYKMTLAKLSLFTIEDGYDRVDGTPLTKITKGEPEYSEMPARNANGSCDLRARPKWMPGWEAVIRVRFDLDQFSVTDMMNLMSRVGQQVGVGEGRPSSPNSDGMGWGLFDIIEVVEHQKVKEDK